MRRDPPHVKGDKEHKKYTQGESNPNRQRTHGSFRVFGIGAN